MPSQSFEYLNSFADYNVYYPFRVFAMISKKLSLFFLLLLGALNSISFAANSLIGQRFEGGDSAFYSFLRSELRYPRSSIRNSVVGLSVASITINPKGKIESITIINSVGKSIDKEVRSALKSTQRRWLACDTITTNQTFYLQVIFNIEIQGNKIDIGVRPLTKTDFSQPIVVVSLVSRNLKLPLSNETLSNELSSLIELKDYKRALPIVNEIVKRRPFEPDLYQLQLFVCKKLNRVDMVEETLHKLDEFVPGISLEKLLAK